MPEGDTILRMARTLHRALSGEEVTRFASAYAHLTRVHDDAPVTGRMVKAVGARGKHLLIHFSGDLILRTHMRMSGRWHVYRAGEPWRLPPSAARIVIGTARFVAVGVNVPEATFHTAVSLERQGALRRLGPDLLAPDFDEGAAIIGMRARAAEPVGEVLLDQRVMAGVGNVFKSETLFLCGIDPYRPVGSIDDDQLRAIVATVRRLLALNVREGSDGPFTHRGLRRTTGRDNPGERLWVYGRRGRPCRRCGTPIAAARRGTAARTTYWCPRCQAG